MKNSRRHHNVTLLAALSLLALPWGSALCETLIKEDFSLSGGDRTSGETIDGTELPQGDVSWICKANTVQFAGTKGDSYATFAAKGQTLAAVELPSEGNVIEVQASVQPTPGGWIAVGIGKPETGLDNTWPEGMFLLLNGDGGYEVYLARAQDAVTSGTRLPNFNESEMNSITLIYDKKDNTLSCIINERMVLNPTSLTTFGFTPNLSSAGFSSFGESTNARSVQDFSVTIE